MKTKSCMSIWLLLSILISCTGTKGKAPSLEDAPVVAHEVNHKNEKLIAADISLVKDTLSVPLSLLVSDFEVIRLENSEEALTTPDGRVFLSDNYIGIYSYLAGGFKLYNKEGKFITNISSSGQGPYEYWIALYDCFMDEKANRIYLASFRADRILVFDFQGNPVEIIPLSYIAHKGRFVMDEINNKLTMMALVFDDTPSVVWEQDLKGNIIQEIPAGHLAVIPGDYSNEIWESLNTEALDYHICYYDLRHNDTLYHYLSHENRLKPVFTMEFNKENSSEYIYNDYIELPDHYLISVYTNHSYDKVLIDKKTNRGAYVNFKYDQFGNIGGPRYISFSRGYFTAIMDSDELSEQLKRVLARKDLSPEMTEKVKDVYFNLTDDDNNILFIGKIKEE